MTINEKLNSIIDTAMKNIDLGKDVKLVVTVAVKDTVGLCLDHFSSPLNPQPKGGDYLWQSLMYSRR